MVMRRWWVGVCAVVLGCAPLVEDGRGAPGDPCESDEACGLDAQCMPLPVGADACLAPCDASCDGCTVHDDEPICTTACDPYDPASCAPGFGCQFGGTTDEGLWLCEPLTGQRGVGEACEDATDCSAGLTCVAGESSWVCTPYCLEQADCPSGTVCSGYSVTHRGRVAGDHDACNPNGD